MGKGGWRFGAGRPGWRRKCEHSQALDVRAIHQKNLLSAGVSFGWQWTDNGGQQTASIGVSVEPALVVLNYQWTPYGQAPRSVTSALPIVRTPCHFGGHRPWFRCPRCDQRCARVYFGGGRFLCRTCQRLGYASEAEDGIGRLWRKQTKLENRLDPKGGKPKRMHWTTYDRICNDIARVEQQKDELFCIGAARRIGLLR